jgi:phage shock protein PspC (stress-responsive transcriptional regulator)
LKTYYGKIIYIMKGVKYIGTVIVEFIMNNPGEVFIIGLVAYIIAGIIMRSANDYFGIWFGSVEEVAGFYG